MLDFAALANNAPIPAVDPEDLRRVWQTMHSRSGDPQTAYSAMLIAEQCLAENADPLAVWARSGLISVLKSLGLLSHWQTENGLAHVVFEAAAAFPLPHGVTNFHPDDLLAQLNRLSKP